MATNLNDFLTKKTGKTEHVSARVPFELYQEVDKLRQRNEHSWSSIVLAGIQLYAAENGAKRGNRT